MENLEINDGLIRDYLLGRIEDETAEAERIDEQLLADEEFCLRVDVIEDEIIEEYLEGALAAGDRLAAERHFFNPPERRRKLKNARLLRRHAATASLDEGSVRTAGSAWSFGRALLGWFVAPAFRTSVGVTASVVMVLSLVYLLEQRRELQIALRQANHQLAAESQHPPALASPGRALVEQSEPLTVMLNLVQPGLQRGNAQLPTVTLGPAVRVLLVTVAVPSGTAGTYRVQLKSRGSMVWWSNRVEALAVSGGSILKLDIPPEILPVGEWQLVLQGPRNVEFSYWFNVSSAG